MTIRLATVHWRDPKWIEPQLAALDRHIASRLALYVNLEGIASHAAESRMHYVTRDGGTHAEKLNSLGNRMVEDGTEGDIIVFLDGDAFPVRPLDAWMLGLLAVNPLAAIRRAENRGDLQPHPCFCVTTVGFWRQISGDWREGPWVNAAGERVSDVGGRLLQQLRAGNHRWTEVLRSNTREFHSVLFGIYGGHIYHHGAGFRLPMTRSDERWWRTAADYNSVWPNRSALDLTQPADLAKLARAAKGRLGRRLWGPWLRSMERCSDDIYRQICRDPEFYLQFES